MTTTTHPKECSIIWTSLLTAAWRKTTSECTTWPWTQTVRYITPPPPPPNNNNHHHPLMEIKKTQLFHIMYSLVSFWGKFMTKLFLVIYKASPNCNAFLVSKLINMYKCVLKIRTLYQSIWQSFHLIFRWQHGHRCRVYSLASPCKYDKEFFHYQKEVQ